MLIQAAPPDTTIYMVGGYLFIFSVLGLYVASLIIRTRNLKRELALLDQLETPHYEEVPGKAEAI